MQVYGISEYGIETEITFETNTEPTKQNINKIEILLNSTKNEKSLEEYLSNVKFIKAEVIIEESE